LVFLALVAQVGKTQKIVKILNNFHYHIDVPAFSSMNEDNLHHPEPEQPDKVPALKKHAGCHISSLWELFTEEVDTQNQTCSTCHNCHKSIAYHKKSERVKDHHIKCPMLTKSMMEMDEDSCPLWFEESLSNKELKSGQSSFSGISVLQTSMKQFFLPCLKQSELKMTKTALLYISTSWVPHSNKYKRSIYCLHSRSPNLMWNYPIVKYCNKS